MKKLCCILLVILVVVSYVSCGDATDTSVEKAKAYAVQDKKSGITYMDFDTIYAMCKDFLKQYYEASVLGQEENLKNVDDIIADKQFYNYIHLKMRYGKILTPEESISILFGVENIKWNLDKGYALIEVVSEVKQQKGGFSESHQFLVSADKGKLFIADWYSQSPGSVSSLDEIVRADTREISIPGIWGDSDLVNSIMKKAKTQVRNRENPQT